MGGSLRAVANSLHLARRSGRHDGRLGEDLQRRHPGARAGGSATIYLDATSEVQPDAFLFRLEPAGPGARQTADGYLEGAPQLVVEVSASSASYDLHDKKEIYRRNDVREYLVWRVLDDAFDWFRLVDDRTSWPSPTPTA